MVIYNTKYKIPISMRIRDYRPNNFLNSHRQGYCSFLLSLLIGLALLLKPRHFLLLTLWTVWVCCETSFPCTVIGLLRSTPLQAIAPSFTSLLARRWCFCASVFQLIVWLVSQSPDIFNSSRVEFSIAAKRFLITLPLDFYWVRTNVEAQSCRSPLS